MYQLFHVPFWINSIPRSWVTVNGMGGVIISSTYGIILVSHLPKLLAIATLRYVPSRTVTLGCITPRYVMLRTLCYVMLRYVAIRQVAPKGPITPIVQIVV